MSTSQNLIKSIDRYVNERPVHLIDDYIYRTSEKTIQMEDITEFGEGGCPLLLEDVFNTISPTSNYFLRSYDLLIKADEELQEAGGAGVGEGTAKIAGAAVGAAKVAKRKFATSTAKFAPWSASWRQGFKGGFKSQWAVEQKANKPVQSTMHDENPRAYYKERGKLAAEFAQTHDDFEKGKITKTQLNKKLGVTPSKRNNDGTINKGQFRHGNQDKGERAERKELIGKLANDEKLGKNERHRLNELTSKMSIAERANEIGTDLDMVEYHVNQIERASNPMLRALDPRLSQVIPPQGKMPERFGDASAMKAISGRFKKNVLRGVPASDVTPSKARDSQMIASQAGQAKIDEQRAQEKKAEWDTYKQAVTEQKEQAAGGKGGDTEDREYLKPGQKPPKDVQEQKSDRGARYYSKKEAEQVKAAKTEEAEEPKEEPKEETSSTEEDAPKTEGDESEDKPTPKDEAEETETEESGSEDEQREADTETEESKDESHEGQLKQSVQEYQDAIGTPQEQEALRLLHGNMRATVDRGEQSVEDVNNWVKGGFKGTEGLNAVDFDIYDKPMPTVPDKSKKIKLPTGKQEKGEAYRERREGMSPEEKEAALTSAIETAASGDSGAERNGFWDAVKQGWEVGVGEAQKAAAAREVKRAEEVTNFVDKFATAEEEGRAKGRSKSAKKGWKTRRKNARDEAINELVDYTKLYGQQKAKKLLSAISERADPAMQTALKRFNTEIDGVKSVVGENTKAAKKEARKTKIVGQRAARKLGRKGRRAAADAMGALSGALGTGKQTVGDASARIIDKLPTNAEDAVAVAQTLQGQVMGMIDKLPTDAAVYDVIDAVADKAVEMGSNAGESLEAGRKRLGIPRIRYGKTSILGKDPKARSQASIYGVESGNKKKGLSRQLGFRLSEDGFFEMGGYFYKTDDRLQLLLKELNDTLLPTTDSVVMKLENYLSKVRDKSATDHDKTVLFLDALTLATEYELSAEDAATFASEMVSKSSASLHDYLDRLNVSGDVFLKANLDTYRTDHVAGVSEMVDAVILLDALNKVGVEK